MQNIGFLGRKTVSTQIVLPKMTLNSKTENGTEIEAIMG